MRCRIVHYYQLLALGFFSNDGLAVGWHRLPHSHCTHRGVFFFTFVCLRARPRVCVCVFV